MKYAIVISVITNREKTGQLLKRSIAKHVAQTFCIATLHNYLRVLTDYWLHTTDLSLNA